MKIPLHVAEKILRLMNGEKIPSSQIEHQIIKELKNEGVILPLIQGRNKSTLYIYNADLAAFHLKTHYGINDLTLYIETLQKDNLKRSDVQLISSNSKLKSIRTFKGFLVSSYEAIDVLLNGKSVTIYPNEGTFVFIYDFESLIPENDVTIIGVENPENFRYIDKQKKLFGSKALFVSRYPYSNDLLKWLNKISNSYIHYGDFDFFGIKIYLNEYKKHLAEKASFFIPDNIENYLKNYGSLNLYNTQVHLRPESDSLLEKNIIELVMLIDKYKKGLEQEIFIKLQH